MSFSYLPWYTGDYLRDTRHLSPLRHGVYLLLLAHCWDQKGPVPLDEQEAAGIANCRSTDEIDALRYVLVRYFVRMDDGWYNKRMAEEIARAEAQSLAYSLAGKKSAAARKARSAVREAQREQRLNRGSTTVEPRSVSPSPSPSPSPEIQSQEREVATCVAPSAPATKTERTATPKASTKKGTRLPADWFLPDAWRDWTVEVFKVDPQAAVRTSLDFRDYWWSSPGSRGVKLDWEATWRRWCRKEYENA